MINSACLYIYIYWFYAKINVYTKNIFDIILINTVIKIMHTHSLVYNYLYNCKGDQISE